MQRKLSFFEEYDRNLSKSIKDWYSKKGKQQDMRIYSIHDKREKIKNKKIKGFDGPID